MLTKDIEKLRLKEMAWFIAYLLLISGSWFLKDAIVYILNKLYEIFIQSKITAI